MNDLPLSGQRMITFPDDTLRFLHITPVDPTRFFFRSWDLTTKAAEFGGDDRTKSLLRVWGQKPPKINGLLGSALVLQPRAAVQKQDHLKHLREELSSSFAKERAEWHLFFMIRFAGSRIIILGTQRLPRWVQYVLFYFIFSTKSPLARRRPKGRAMRSLSWHGSRNSAQTPCRSLDWWVWPRNAVGIDWMQIPIVRLSKNRAWHPNLITWKCLVLFTLGWLWPHICSLYPNFGCSHAKPVGWIWFLFNCFGVNSPSLVGVVLNAVGRIQLLLSRSIIICVLCLDILYISQHFVGWMPSCWPLICPPVSLRKAGTSELRRAIQEQCRRQDAFCLGLYMEVSKNGGTPKHWENPLILTKNLDDNLGYPPF